MTEGSDRQAGKLLDVGKSFTVPVDDVGKSFTVPVDKGKRFTVPVDQGKSFTIPVNKDKPFTVPEEDLGESFTVPEEDLSKSFTVPEEDLGKSLTVPEEDVGTWVTLISVIGMNMLTQTMTSTYSVMYQQLRDKYNTSREAIGYVFFGFGILGTLGGILSAPAMHKYGCQKVAVLASVLRATGYFMCMFAGSIFTLVIYFSVISGLGYGMGRVSSITIIQKLFSTNKNRATRVSCLGFFAGSAVGPLLVGQLRFSLEGTFQLLSSCMMIGVVLPLFWEEKTQRNYSKYLRGTPGCSVERREGRSYDNHIIDRHREIQTENATFNEIYHHEEISIHRDKSNKFDYTHTISKKVQQFNNYIFVPKLTQLQHQVKSYYRSFSDITLLYNTRFILFITLRFAWQSCKLTSLVHIVNAARELGVSDRKAALLPVLVSVSGFTCAIINSSLARVRCLTPMTCIVFGLTSQTVGCFLVLSRDYSMLILAMILLGIDEGVTFPSLCVTLNEITGQDQFARALSLSDLGQIPALFVGGPLAGWLADHTGEYRITYMCGGSLGLVAVIIAYVIHLIPAAKTSYRNPPTMRTSS